MEEENKDKGVGGESPAPGGEGKDVVTQPDPDKESNLANLRKLVREERKKREDVEKERDALKGNPPKKEEPESLDLESNKEKKVSEAEKLLFDRDLKKAVNRWSKEHKVTKEEWAEIKKKVTLNGDELDDEIYEKISSAYEGLPNVKEKRESELIEKGKKEAMKQFQDSELDFGGGGDSGNGGNQPTKRFTSQENKFLNAFGVTEEERKGIDKESNAYSGWTILDKARADR